MIPRTREARLAALTAVPCLVAYGHGVAPELDYTRLAALVEAWLAAQTDECTRLHTRTEAL